MAPFLPRSVLTRVRRLVETDVLLVVQIGELTVSVCLVTAVRIVPFVAVEVPEVIGTIIPVVPVRSITVLVSGRSEFALISVKSVNIPLPFREFRLRELRFRISEHLRATLIILAMCGPFLAKAFAPLKVIAPIRLTALKVSLFPTSKLWCVLIVRLEVTVVGAESIRV